jgi:hypothetical protein
VRVLAAFALVLLLAPLAPAGDVPAPDCPPAGFERAACLLAAARARPRCGPRRFETKLDRLLGRVRRTMRRAERATDRGRLGRVRTLLGRVEHQLAAFDTRAQLLAFRGTLAGPCEAEVAAVLAGLRDTVRSLREGAPPTTTTTTTVGSATTTLASLPGTTVTTATATTTTSTTTVPACGNGRLDPGEQCDGTNLFGRTCQDLGFVGGTLACDHCIFDNRGCHQ